MEHATPATDSTAINAGDSGPTLVSDVEAKVNDMRISPEASFKVLLVGNSGVGKSALLHRLQTGEFDTNYIATIGMQITPLTFETTRGSVTFNVWDCAGQETSDGMRNECYVGVQAAILMFEVSSRISYQDVPNWYRDVTKVCEDIPPIVLCGNKCDVDHRAVKPKFITFHRKKNLMYCDVSVKSNFQVLKPFLWLLRRLKNDPALEITSNRWKELIIQQGPVTDTYDEEETKIPPRQTALLPVRSRTEAEPSL